MARPKANKPTPSANPPLHASDRARRRRVAAESRARSAHVVICASDASGPPALRGAIESLGFDVDAFSTFADALRGLARTSPDVVVIELADCDPECIRMLQLLRRSAPQTPLVIVSQDGSLGARAACQPLRPFYYAVPPISKDELRSALNSALEHRTARA